MVSSFQETKPSNVRISSYRPAKPQQKYTISVITPFPAPNSFRDIELKSIASPALNLGGLEFAPRTRTFTNTDNTHRTISSCKQGYRRNLAIVIRGSSPGNSTRVYGAFVAYERGVCNPAHKSPRNSPDNARGAPNDHHCLAIKKVYCRAAVSRTTRFLSRGSIIVSRD